MDKNTFLHVVRTPAEMRQFLNNPALGTKVLSILEGYAGSFDTCGVVAGQSVASAIDEILGLTTHLRYNDVDIFTTSKQEHVEHLFRFRSIVKDAIHYAVVSDVYAQKLLYDDFGIDTCNEASVETLLANKDSVYVRMAADNAFEGTRLYQYVIESLKANNSWKGYQDIISGRLVNNKMIHSQQSIESEIQFEDTRLGYPGMDNCVKGTLSSLYAMLGVENTNTARQYIYTTEMNCEVYGTYRARLAVMDHGENSFCADEQSITYGMGVVSGFDINAVAVGVDLKTGQMVYSDAYVRYLCNRQLTLMIGTTPVQSLSRMIDKAATTATYFDMEKEIETVKAFLLLTSMRYADTDATSEHRVTALSAFGERIQRIRGSAYDGFKDMLKVNTILGPQTLEKIGEQGVLLDHFEFLPSPVGTSYYPLPKNMKIALDDCVRVANQVSGEVWHVAASLEAAKALSDVRKAKAPVKERTVRALSLLSASSPLPEFKKVTERQFTKDEIRLLDNNLLYPRHKFFAEHAEAHNWYNQESYLMFLTEFGKIMEDTPKIKQRILEEFNLVNSNEQRADALISGAVHRMTEAMGDVFHSQFVNLPFEVYLDVFMKETPMQVIGLESSIGKLSITLDFRKQDDMGNELVDWQTVLCRLKDAIVHPLSRRVFRTMNESFGLKHILPSTQAVLKKWYEKMNGRIQNVAVEDHPDPRVQFYRTLHAYAKLWIETDTLHQYLQTQPRFAKVDPLPLDAALEISSVDETLVKSIKDNFAIKELLTSTELSQEGHDMSHCVGGYFDKVQQNRSRIISYTHTASGDRATAELIEHSSGEIYCAQLKAYRNTRPTDMIKQVNELIISGLNKLPRDERFTAVDMVRAGSESVFDEDIPF